jgi:ketosteroid isomerase-like protein
MIRFRPVLLAVAFAWSALLCAGRAAAEVPATQPTAAPAPLQLDEWIKRHTGVSGRTLEEGERLMQTKAILIDSDGKGQTRYLVPVPDGVVSDGGSEPSELWRWVWTVRDGKIDSTSRNYCHPRNKKELQEKYNKPIEEAEANEPQK